MSFEFHINGNQTTFFILFVLRSCTFGFADYIFPVRRFRLLNINPGQKGELNMIKSRSMSWQSAYPVNMTFRFIWETTWKKI